MANFFEIGHEMVNLATPAQEVAEKYWQLLRRLLFIVVQLRKLLLHHSYTILQMYSSQ